MNSLRKNSCWNTDLITSKITLKNLVHNLKKKKKKVIYGNCIYSNYIKLCIITVHSNTLFICIWKLLLLNLILNLLQEYQKLLIIHL